MCVCVLIFSLYALPFSPSFSLLLSPHLLVFYSIWTCVHRHCVPLHDTPESFHLAEQLVSCRCGGPIGSSKQRQLAFCCACTGWSPLPVCIQQNTLRKQQEQMRELNILNISRILVLDATENSFEIKYINFFCVEDSFFD